MSTILKTRIIEELDFEGYQSHMTYEVWDNSRVLVNSKVWLNGELSRTETVILTLEDVKNMYNDLLTSRSK